MCRPTRCSAICQMISGAELMHYSTPTGRWRRSAALVNMNWNLEVVPSGIGTTSTWLECLTPRHSTILDAWLRSISPPWCPVRPRAATSMPNRRQHSWPTGSSPVSEAFSAPQRRWLCRWASSAVPSASAYWLTSKLMRVEISSSICI